MVIQIASASHQLGCEKAKVERLEKQIASLEVEKAKLQKQLDKRSKSSATPSTSKNVTTVNQERFTLKS